MNRFIKLQHDGFDCYFDRDLIEDFHHNGVNLIVSLRSRPDSIPFNSTLEDLLSQLQEPGPATLEPVKDEKVIAEGWEWWGVFSAIGDLRLACRFWEDAEKFRDMFSEQYTVAPIRITRMMVWYPAPGEQG